MKPLIVLCAAIGALCLSTAPAEARQTTAFTVRPTALKARHYSDAKTLRNLSQNTRVEIIGRHGSWNHVKTGGRTGWVKMLSLRLGGAPTGYSSDNGFRTLFNVAANGGNAATTTGVRGLSEAKLMHPHPDPQQLQKMHQLQVGAAEAEHFAKYGKLVTQQMAYLPNPAK